MAAATVQSAFFHPQHILTAYHYSEASTCPCAACERVVTGMGYRCGQCNFNIHEACSRLPLYISSDRHPGHRLTLTLLGGSRWCNLCKETSHAGRYTYLCATCNFDLHPRCTYRPQPPPGRGARRRNRFGPLFFIRMGFRVVDLIRNPHDVVTLVAGLFTGN